MSLTTWTEAVIKDLHYAVRQFVRNPVFTGVAVLSLALGIGANTAIFSVLDSVLLRSLPVRDPQELVILTDPNSSGVNAGFSSGERGLLSYAEFTQLRDHATSFSGLCVAESEMDRRQVRIAGGDPEDARMKLVSEEYFSVLGVEPAIGRFFTKDDGNSPGQDPLRRDLRPERPRPGHDLDGGEHPDRRGRDRRLHSRSAGGPGDKIFSGNNLAHAFRKTLEIFGVGSDRALAFAEIGIRKIAEC